MKSFILSSEERLALGATHALTFTHNDLTEATAATGQTIDAMTLPVGTVASLAGIKLVTPFEDTGDSANNSCTIKVGDAGDDDRFLTATELNKNGTEITYAPGTGTRQAYPSAGTLKVAFGAPPSDKSLADLNAGEVHVYVNLVDFARAKAEA